MIDRIEDELVKERKGEETDISGYVDEVGKELVPDKEVEGFIEKVEKEGERVGSVVMDDQGQQVVVSDDGVSDDAQLPDDAVVLPMTQDEFQVGIHEPLIRGVRWLAEWCAYMIKKFGEKVFFRG